MKAQAETEASLLTEAELKDLKVLAQFTSVYCKVHHEEEKAPLQRDEEQFRAFPLEKFPVCEECQEFLSYAFERRLRCPLEEKPSCKHCDVHCFRPGHREKVKEIMRFSGQYLIKRGRLDLLWHYWF